MFDNTACFRPLLAAATLAATLGFSACSPADSTDMEDFADETDTVDHASTEINSTGRRYITNHPMVGCRPVPAPWVGRPLFQYPGVTTPPALSRYCLYTFNDAKRPSDTQKQELVAAVNAGVWMAYGPVIPVEDPVVMGPLGFAQESREFFRKTVLQHAGALSQLPVGQPLSLKTRIAFPDTSPEETSGYIPGGRMDHGLILASLARDIASTPAQKSVQATQAAHITTGIALPQVDNDVEDLTQGGYFGTRGQLAEAIYRVTAAWRAKAEDATNPQPRLVVNLSVGWEPTDGCSTATSGTSLQAPGRAVFDAITHANCLGAAVVAAAGNHPGHDSSGAKQTKPAEPVCPAAWAQLPAPTLPQCQKFMGNDKYFGFMVPFKAPIAATNPPATGVDNPLLFAVGGVDFGRRPIAETRAKGFPKQAAIATHASAGPAGTDLPAAITGTSVSAGVVSAIAGTVWAYRPELTAPEVMGLVYATGEPIGLNSAFGTQQPTTVRAASLCHALAKACAPNNQGKVPPACPLQPLTCKFPTWSVDANPPMPQHLLELLAELFKVSTPVQSEDPFVGSVAQDAYPAASAPPWVYPQPLRPPCSACAFALHRDISSPVLHIQIDPNFDQTVRLEEASLLVRTSLTSSMTLGLGTGALTRGSQVTITFGTLALPSASSVYISWVTRDASLRPLSVTERILVTP
jgi:hypothetical protein